jgi:hypothetical protein
MTQAFPSTTQAEIDCELGLVFRRKFSMTNTSSPSFRWAFDFPELGLPVTCRHEQNVRLLGGGSCSAT